MGDFGRKGIAECTQDRSQGHSGCAGITDWEVGEDHQEAHCILIREGPSQT